MSEFLFAAKRLRNTACEYGRPCPAGHDYACDRCPTAQAEKCEWWVLCVRPFDQAAKEAEGE